MAAKRHTGGVLRGIRSAAAGKKKKKKKTPLRVALSWIGGAIIGGLLLVALGVNFVRMFRPDILTERVRAKHAIEEIVAGPGGERSARLTVQGREVLVPVGPESELAEGDRLELLYVWYPRDRGKPIEVREWTALPESAP